MDTKLLSTDRPVALYYVLQSEVESFTKIDSSRCSIVLSGDWRLINTTIGTIDLKEEASQTAAGVLHENDLSAVCPGHDEDTPGNIAVLAGRKVILRLDYRNGMKKIIGDKSDGPKLFFKISSGRTTSRTLESEFKSFKPNPGLV